MTLDEYLLGGTDLHDGDTVEWWQVDGTGAGMIVGHYRAIYHERTKWAEHEWSREGGRMSTGADLNQQWSIYVRRGNDWHGQGRVDRDRMRDWLILGAGAADGMLRHGAAKRARAELIARLVALIKATERHLEELRNALPDPLGKEDDGSIPA